MDFKKHPTLILNGEDQAKKGLENEELKVENESILEIIKPIWFRPRSIKYQYKWIN